MILVSACLVGVNCKYSGESNDTEEVHRYLENKVFVPICPEQLGGLTTPRPTCEIIGERVMSEHGVDCTEAFITGAEEVFKIAKLTGATEALLKEGSPSCGCHKVYDGTFSGQKITGMGFTAKLLRAHGITVISEKDLSNQ